jgi:hypothetical protein
MRAERAGNAPSEQARILGMETVSYADVHRHSLIAGLWGSTTLVIHGQHEIKSAEVAAAEKTVRPKDVSSPCAVMTRAY